MSLKQSGPGRNPGHKEKRNGIGVEGEYRPFFLIPQENCAHCAFYELIHKARRSYGLCHLSGLKNPIAGMSGCCFIAGSWEELDQILGLTEGNYESILNFPNNDRQSDSLVHAQHGENSGISILKCHLSCRNRHEDKLAVTRPGSVRTGGLSLAGERVTAFCFKP